MRGWNALLGCKWFEWVIFTKIFNLPIFAMKRYMLHLYLGATKKSKHIRDVAN